MRRGLCDRTRPRCPFVPSHPSQPPSHATRHTPPQPPLPTTTTEARARSPYFGASRPLLPAALGGARPHLAGAVAGDYGWDPLGLAADPNAFKRYHEIELLHARWAMLGAVGALVPEALSLGGVELGEPVWWRVGAAKLNSDLTLNWGGIEGFRIAGKQGIGIIAACQVCGVVCLLFVRCWCCRRQLVCGCFALPVLLSA